MRILRGTDSLLIRYVHAGPSHPCIGLAREDWPCETSANTGDGSDMHNIMCIKYILNSPLTIIHNCMQGAWNTYSAGRGCVYHH